MEAEHLYYSSERISGINFRVYSTRDGIYSIDMNKPSAPLKGTIKLHQNDPWMFGVFDQLQEYFYSKRKNFTIPLYLEGTQFQKAVWNQLLKIPYGKTATYKDIALKLGSEKKTRAVGQANGANRIPIIIPCHRVINTGGTIGGYSGGVGIKEKLLELEGSLSLELFEH